MYTRVIIRCTLTVSSHGLGALCSVNVLRLQSSNVTAHPPPNTSEPRRYRTGSSILTDSVVTRFTPLSHRTSPPLALPQTGPAPLANTIDSPLDAVFCTRHFAVKSDSAGAPIGRPPRRRQRRALSARSAGHRVTPTTSKIHIGDLVSPIPRPAGRASGPIYAAPDGEKFRTKRGRKGRRAEWSGRTASRRGHYPVNHARIVRSLSLLVYLHIGQYLANTARPYRPAVNNVTVAKTRRHLDYVNKVRACETTPHQRR